MNYRRTATAQRTYSWFYRGVGRRIPWNEPGHQTGSEELAPVSPIQMLIEGQPHPKEEHHTRPAWLEISSGQLRWSEPGDASGFRQVWAPAH